MKKNQDALKTTGPVKCKAARLDLFTKAFLGAAATLEDPVGAAATLRTMATPKTDPLHKRQLLAARIALLSLDRRSSVLPVVAEATPDPEPMPEPAAEPPPEPVEPPKKKPVVSILSMDDASQLFSAFAISDPATPAAQPPEMINIPDPETNALPELEVITDTPRDATMDLIPVEDAPAPDLQAAPPPKRRSRKAKPEEPEPPAAKPSQARGTNEKPKPKPKTNAPLAEDGSTPAAPAPATTEGQRARRSGESRILSADGQSAKPKIDFSALASLASLSDPEESEQPEPIPSFKAGLKIDLAGASFLSDLTSLSSGDEEDPATPAETKP